MAVKTVAQLKALWVTDFKPEETDYADLFDSFLNLITNSDYLFNDTYIFSNFVGAVSNPFAGNTRVKKIIFLNCPGITDLTINNNTVLSSVNLSNSRLNVIAITVTNCPLVILLDVAGCGTLATIDFHGNTSLVSIETTDTSSITNGDFNGCALDTMNVDSILAMCNSGGLAGGTLNLSGGTNSIPTGGVANADYIALLGKGWSVNINT